MIAHGVRPVVGPPIDREVAVVEGIPPLRDRPVLCVVGDVDGSAVEDLCFEAGARLEEGGGFISWWGDNRQSRCWR